LNATTFSMIVSDLFLNIQREQYKGNNYFKDRGYAFERKLNRNVDGIFDRPLSYFKDPETKGHFPMVIMNPTIINDGRSLYVSPIGVSYMITRPLNADLGHQPLPDGIEYTRFFNDMHPNETRFSDLLRANATFPYIMPAVSLPTEPAINIMDAGIRDNYGIRNAARFLYVFRDWISKNTAGVVFIQIRDNHKEVNLDNKNNQSILSRILSPLQNLSGNFLLMQDYSQDEQLQYITEFLDCRFDYVSLEVPLMDEKVALSWHLTKQEKNTIARSVHSPENRAELKRLKKIFEDID
ncbi:MAG: patatin-like phospholipase family protein, partial [Bacteroidota bacterium]